MQSVIRKIKSLPSLLKRDNHILSHSQLLQQFDQLEALINTMIDESNDDTILVYPCNKDPQHQYLYPRNTVRRVISEAHLQRLYRSFYLLFCVIHYNSLSNRFSFSYHICRIVLPPIVISSRINLFLIVIPLVIRIKRLSATKATLTQR